MELRFQPYVLAEKDTKSETRTRETSRPLDFESVAESWLLETGLAFNSRGRYPKTAATASRCWSRTRCLYRRDISGV